MHLQKLTAVLALSATALALPRPGRLVARDFVSNGVLYVETTVIEYVTVTEGAAATSAAASSGDILTDLLPSTTAAAAAVTPSSPPAAAPPAVTTPATSAAAP